jgi:hypothetical protein
MLVMVVDGDIMNHERINDLLLIFLLGLGDEPSNGNNKKNSKNKKIKDIVL